MFDGTLPDPSQISPSIVGALPLGFRMPPMMEEAFGYQGSLRFIEFSFSPNTLQFGHSDGADHVQSDEKLWMRFVNHPLILVQLRSVHCPTIFGEFELRRTRAPRCPEEFDEMKRELGKWHCLLFDRRERQPYLCTREQMVLFFPLTEPDGLDDHTVFVDGLLLSPGSEDYQIESTVEIAEQLISCLDNEVRARARVKNIPRIWGTPI